MRAASPPSWRFFARHVTPRMKKISSFFDALPPRKRPATAEDPKADLQCSQEDHVMQHEEKKKCDQRSRNFQPSWKKTYPWLRFIEGKMYCATCVDSNKSAERLANPNSTIVTGTDNFRLDSIRSHESSIPHLQVTKAFMFLCFDAILRKFYFQKHLLLYQKKCN